MPLFCAVRYFLDITYKGTNYSGWQIQANANTVQAEVNKALNTLINNPTETMGSGRTDTGVHAHQQIAHFDCTQAIENSNDFVYKLNALLPRDIAIRHLRPVKPEAHARFDAISRSYKYFIHSRKEPFISHTSYFFGQSLNIEAINQVVDIIKDWKDFEAFSKVHTEVNHFNCHIFDARWELTDRGHVFYIRADRFLRGMVRALVGTLLDVGQKRTSPEAFKKILESKDRRKAGRAVPPDGLYLHEIEYPKDIYL